MSPGGLGSLEPPGEVDQVGGLLVQMAEEEPFCSRGSFVGQSWAALGQDGTAGPFTGVSGPSWLCPKETLMERPPSSCPAAPGLWEQWDTLGPRYALRCWPGLVTPRVVPG